MSDTFDDLNQRFQEALRGIGARDTERAVTKILIQVGVNTAPRIPIDTSFLINSQYRKVEQTATGYAGEIGYGARYAAAVHEASGKLKGQPRADFGTTREGVAFGGGTGVGNYWDPAGEPKFFEKGIEDTIPMLPQILREEYSE